MLKNMSFQKPLTPRLNHTVGFNVIKTTPQNEHSYGHQQRKPSIKYHNKSSQTITKDNIYPVYQQHNRKSFVQNKMLVNAKIKHTEYFSIQELQYAIYKMLQNMNVNTKALGYFVNCKGLKSILSATQQCLQAHFNIEKSQIPFQPITSLKTHSYKLSSMRQELLSLQNQLASKKKQLTQLNFNMARFKIDYQIVFSKAENLQKINKDLLQMVKNNQKKKQNSPTPKANNDEKQNEVDFMNICWGDSGECVSQRKKMIQHVASDIKIKTIDKEKYQKQHQYVQQQIVNKQLQSKIWQLTVKIVQLQKQNSQLKKQLETYESYMNEMNKQYQKQAKKWAQMQNDYERQLKRIKQFHYRQNQDY